jgi:hypothetical protein
MRPRRLVYIYQKKKRGSLFRTLIHRTIKKRSAIRSFARMAAPEMKSIARSADLPSLASKKRVVSIVSATAKPRPSPEAIAYRARDQLDAPLHYTCVAVLSNGSWVGPDIDSVATAAAMVALDRDVSLAIAGGAQFSMSYVLELQNCARAAAASMRTAAHAAAVPGA